MRRLSQAAALVAVLSATAWLVAEPRDVLEVAGPVATEHIGPKPKAISLGDGSVSSKTGACSYAFPIEVRDAARAVAALLVRSAALRIGGRRRLELGRVISRVTSAGQRSSSAKIPSGGRLITLAGAGQARRTPGHLTASRTRNDETGLLSA
jgi:hypothetical protein